MNFFKQHLICILFVFVLVIVLIGCGSQEQESKVVNSKSYEMDPVLNTPGTIPICKETVDLRIMMEQNTNTIDLTTNKYTKKIEEYGNVKLSFETVPGADISTKVNLIMNSGGDDLPDIIITSKLSKAQIALYGADGMIVPLNKYYENSSYYLKQGLEKVSEKDILKYVTAADGNIYSVPYYAESIQNEFANLMWIYEPWLEKLNLPMPKTLDEFRNTLQAFRDNDMNGNGDKTDELPLVDDKNYKTLYCLMNTFINFNPDVNKLSVRDGKLTFAYTDDRWREGLKYIRSLVEGGMFTPVSFTMANEQLRTIIANEENKIGVFSWISPSIIPASSERRGEYKLLLLKGENGSANMTYLPTIPSERFFITKNCEHPEVAFRIGDLMCSEEMTIWNRWGEKGVDWDVPPEGTPSLYDFLGYPAIIQPILVWGSSQNSHWENSAPGFRTYEIAAGTVSGGDKSQLAKAEAVKMLVGQEPKETVASLSFTIDEMEEYYDIVQVADTFVNEKMIAFITGVEDIDSGWDAYIAELKNIGVDRALDIAQTAYDRMNKQ